MSIAPGRLSAPSYESDPYAAAEADSNWRAEHDAELLARYAGQWIAIRAGAIIGVGDTGVAASEQAEQVTRPGGYILCAIDRPEWTDAVIRLE